MATLESILQEAVTAISDGWGEQEDKRCFEQLRPFFEKAIANALGIAVDHQPSANPGLVEAKNAMEACFVDTPLSGIAMGDRIRIIQLLRSSRESKDTVNKQVEDLLAALQKVSARNAKLERNVSVYEQTLYVMLDSRVKG